MKATIGPTTWHGVNAWFLENDILKTVIVPDIGAKLVSLVDKRTQTEWLIGPGDRPFKKVTYGASFVEQDMSGWDEMFPTIVPCPYPVPGEKFGLPLPDHGEVWTLPWQAEQTRDKKITLSVISPKLPYRLTRTAQFRSLTILELHYQLENLGQERMPYIWAAHPQFACGSGAEVILPPHVTKVCNTIPPAWGWGEPETVFGWPEAIALDGKRVRIDRIGPASLRKARKFFLLPEVQAGWVGLVRQAEGDWLRLVWDPNLIPYFGLWVDEGALNHESVATPEPTTGFYDSLAVAWDKEQVTVIKPGATHTWKLALQVGTTGQPFPVY